MSHLAAETEHDTTEAHCQTASIQSEKPIQEFIKAKALGNKIQSNFRKI